MSCGQAPQCKHARGIFRGCSQFGGSFPSAVRTSHPTNNNRPTNSMCDLYALGQMLITLTNANYVMHQERVVVFCAHKNSGTVLQSCPVGELPNTPNAQHPPSLSELTFSASASFPPKAPIRNRPPISISRRQVERIRRPGHEETRALFRKELVLCVVMI